MRQVLELALFHSGESGRLEKLNNLSPGTRLVLEHRPDSRAGACNPLPKSGPIKGWAEQRAWLLVLVGTDVQDWL